MIPQDLIRLSTRIDLPFLIDFINLPNKWLLLILIVVNVVLFSVSVIVIGSSVKFSLFVQDPAF